MLLDSCSMNRVSTASLCFLSHTPRRFGVRGLGQWFSLIEPRCFLKDACFEEVFEEAIFFGQKCLTSAKNGPAVCSQAELTLSFCGWGRWH